MSTEIIMAILVAVGSVGTATGAAIKMVYTRITTKTDQHHAELTEKLSQCEEKHEECEANNTKVSNRLASIEGFMRGKGWTDAELGSQEA